MGRASLRPQLGVPSLKSQDTQSLSRVCPSRFLTKGLRVLTLYSHEGWVVLDLRLYDRSPEPDRDKVRGRQGSTREGMEHPRSSEGREGQL